MVNVTGAYQRPEIAFMTWKAERRETGDSFMFFDVTLTKDIGPHKAGTKFCSATAWDRKNKVLLYGTNGGEYNTGLDIWKDKPVKEKKPVPKKKSEYTLEQILEAGRRPRQKPAS